VDSFFLQCWPSISFLAHEESALCFPVRRTHYYPNAPEITMSRKKPIKNLFILCKNPIFVFWGTALLALIYWRKNPRGIEKHRAENVFNRSVFFIYILPKKFLVDKETTFLGPGFVAKVSWKSLLRLAARRRPVR
jgi:hypothetical protein